MKTIMTKVVFQFCFETHATFKESYRPTDAEAAVIPAVVGGGADGRGGAGLPERLAAHLRWQPQLHQRLLQSIQQVRTGVSYTKQ